MLTVPLLLVSTILIAYTVTQAIYYDYLISELKCKIETEAQKKKKKPSLPSLATYGSELNQ